ncbi:MAG: hypothetical protein ACRCUA_02720, partial [Fusobacteriaceae bacterium]
MSLYYNSGLTTFKVCEGKYFSPPIEKSILLILQKLQVEMRKNFKNNLENMLLAIIDKNFLSDSVNKIHCGKEKEIPIEWINLNFDIKSCNFLNSFDSSNEFEKLNENNLFSFFVKLKNFCKSLTIKKYSDSHHIDLLQISKKVNCRVKDLKKLFTNALNTQLKFNYINKKKLNISLISFVFTDIHFPETNNSRNQTMYLKIPENIL